MESTTIKKRVLSIQSHVVHGYVGNKSATFPLEVSLLSQWIRFVDSVFDQQVLGFEVDAINSVQFSNHTGYKVVKGQVLQEKELADLFEGLEKNNLLQHYSHLLTGYIGNASFLRQVSAIVKKLREINPDLIYVCDPVMGDDGTMYVPKELLPIYRDEIIPLADIITPNQYEVELLVEKPLKTDEDVWSAVKWFHETKGIKTVVISSSEIVKSSSTLKSYLSECNGNKYTLEIPKQGSQINISFTGTGDLFAALFLAHSYNNTNLGSALENTIASLQAVIKNTLSLMPKDILSGERTEIHSHDRELKLIQSKKELEEPKVVLRVQNI